MFKKKNIFWAINFGDSESEIVYYFESIITKIFFFFWILEIFIWSLEWVFRTTFANFRFQNYTKKWKFKKYYIRKFWNQLFFVLRRNIPQIGFWTFGPWRGSKDTFFSSFGLAQTGSYCKFCKNISYWRRFLESRDPKKCPGNWTLFRDWF